MKIAYCGDLHIDFYISETNPQSPNYEKQIHNYINNVLKPIKHPADILLLAGDIGHYNRQNIDVLIALKAYYPQIALVVGNHDAYLLSRSQQDHYNYSSAKRVKEFSNMCADNSIYCLNGETITINDKTIAGLPMWYDLPTKADIQHWNNYLNDSRYIVEGFTIPAYSNKQALPFDTQAFYLSQVEKLKALPATDILLTHVCPTILPASMRAHGFVSSDYNIFYESNNSANVKASICIFGHSHNVGSFIDGQTTYYTNSIGYPSEQIPSNLTILEI